MIRSSQRAASKRWNKKNPDYSKNYYAKNKEVIKQRQREQKWRNAYRYSPLTIEEKRVLVRIAKRFPDKRRIIDAAHREEVWRKKSAGSLIPYSDAFELKEI